MGSFPESIIIYPYKHFGSPCQANSIKVRQPERVQALLSYLGSGKWINFLLI